MYHITLAWAQLEKRQLTERVRAGMERARSEGKGLGRPPRKRSVADHPRWPRVLRALEQSPTRAEAARKLHVRKATLIEVLAAFPKGERVDNSPKDTLQEPLGRVGAPQKGGQVINPTHSSATRGAFLGRMLARCPGNVRVDPVSDLEDDGGRRDRRQLRLRQTYAGAPWAAPAGALSGSAAPAGQGPARCLRGAAHPPQPDLATDFSEFETIAGATWQISGYVDYWAKVCLTREPRATKTALDAVASLEAAIAEAERLLGMPLAEDCVNPITGEVDSRTIVTDNGSACCAGSFERFIDARPHLAHVRTRYRAPQTNGVIERFFGCLK